MKKIIKWFRVGSYAIDEDDQPYLPIYNQRDKLLAKVYEPELLELEEEDRVLARFHKNGKDKSDE